MLRSMMRNLLGEGALSASFVPVYSNLLAKGDEKGARALAGAVLGLLMVAVSALTIAGIVAAPALTKVLAFGFSPDKLELTTRLTRIMFPMTALMVLSGWCLGVQNSHRRFFWSYASAAMWNIAQIVLLIGWGSRASSQTQLALWLAWATLGGSLLQIAAQLPEVLRLVKPFTISLDRQATGVKQALSNIGPVVTALGVVQLSSFVDLQIASFLPNGAVSNISYANTIVLLPVALFGVSVAASSLPEFSRESVAFAALLERLRGGWQRILFYIVPSAVACIAYGDLLVGLVYRSGKFGASQQQAVHAVLAAFAVGLISFGSVKLMASAYYAMQDYRTPLKASLASLFASAIISVAFAWPLRHSVYGAAAIALGTAVGSYVNLSILVRGLRLKLGALYTPAMWHGTRRIFGATAIAAMVAAPLRWLLWQQRPWFAGPPTLALFSAVYLVSAWLMGSGEAARWLRQRPRGSVVV
jgi:putative peptidoglycan lipid II flippase